MFTQWKLKDFAPGEGVALGIYTTSPVGADWIDVDVPGDVHRALIATGRISDPFYDTNELACAWMEEREWWYRTTFINSTPLQVDERLLLVFKGLDTFATLWLNGQELGRSANMFHEWVFDVSQKVLPGQENTLALCFHPPLKAVEGKVAPSFGWLGMQDQVPKTLMRKAQFGYGWDWGPRLPTIGIWRPVELRRQRQAALDGLHFYTEAIGEDSAHVVVKIDIDRFSGNAPLQVQVRLKDADQQVVGEQLLSLPADDPTPAASLTVLSPHLWWTHDFGEPYLYTLDVTLLQDGVELDRRSMPVGIRTLTLDQSPDPDEPGTQFFRFVLNGVPIFAKGADWIPADSFVGAIPAAQYERWIMAARQANMNMLRVWGGGIYEHDIFYDLCDRLGILIWQDFMFACNAYPEDDPDFVEEVRREAVYQVKRLRSHPCMAIWVGNNECQMIGGYVKLITKTDAPLPGDLYYETILPEVVGALDGQLPYWPGSPYGGRHPNDQAMGDVHDWTVWHGAPAEDIDLEELLKNGMPEPTPERVAFTRYAEDKGRFISEFGMHASPVLETLRRVIPEDQLYHHSPSMDHHNKDNPKNKGDMLMLGSTGLPKDLLEYIDFSMIAQAEGLKFGIEHFRRRKPHCSGALIWQLNDCWPVLSWAIMDYYGFGKAGYYYTRRVYAPLLASFKALKNGLVELWITNDTLKPFEESVLIQFGSFDSGKIWDETVMARVPANTSQPVWRYGPERFAAGPDRYLAVRSPQGSFPANRHFFVPIKDLQRAVVQPIVKVDSVNEHELCVRVEAPAYVYYFHLLVPDERTWYSDNYFDLAGGECAEIVVRNPKVVLKPEMVTFGWR
jgi:beta-mannosidase